MGTLGLLLAGKRRGFLAAVKPPIDCLIQNGFRVAADLYKRVLADAGEGP
jgi:predicted nucleic acid-binding protein